jgi:glyoxylase-like metal-dependent hydrolase (beta-lactamase superfamily II)
VDNLQWTVGDVTVTRIVESVAPVPPNGLLPTSTPEGIERNRSWLYPHFLDDDGNLVLSIHALCVESQGRKIVVDTCIGNDRVVPGYEYLQVDTPFLQNLVDVGFPREEVDFVICTHLHFDHVGWNTHLVNGRWVPTFPNARYLFSRKEFDHWQMLRDTGGYHGINHLKDSIDPVVEAGLVDFISNDRELSEEIRLLPTPGHTPDHVSVYVKSRGEEAVITGDLMHHPIQLAMPGRAATFDMDKPMGARTRVAFVERYRQQPVLVIGSHFADPGAGYIVRHGDACRLDSRG